MNLVVVVEEVVLVKVVVVVVIILYQVGIIVELIPKHCLLENENTHLK